MLSSPYPLRQSRPFNPQPRPHPPSGLHKSSPSTISPSITPNGSTSRLPNPVLGFHFTNNFAPVSDSSPMHPLISLHDSGFFDYKRSLSSGFFLVFFVVILYKYIPIRTFSTNKMTLICPDITIRTLEWGMRGVSCVMKCYALGKVLCVSTCHALEKCYALRKCYVLWERHVLKMGISVSAPWNAITSSGEVCG